MGIKRIFYETSILLTIITLFVVVFNSVQVQRNAALSLRGIEEQYLNATFEIYQNQLIGDILIGDNNIISSLIQEISEIRNVGVVLINNNKKYASGPIGNANYGATYALNIDNEKQAKLKLFVSRNKSVYEKLFELAVPVILQLVILCIGIYFLLTRIKQGLISPLNELVLKMETGQLEELVPNNKSASELKKLCKTLQRMNSEVKKNAFYEAEARAAKQVAHDIRSPLACLNLLLSSTQELPEKQRLLMRTSIQRITDIANVLQKKADTKENSSGSSSDFEYVMVITHVELLVTEIRMQLESNSNVNIDLSIDKAYGLFSNVKISEFNRVLSNLINNSLESFNDSEHNIKISIYCENNNIMIVIEDDGQGIPNDILHKVGAYGFSHGKDFSKTSGNGLGVYHAINTIKSFNGDFKIDSEYNVGTKVTISLPKAKPPSWFVNQIQLTNINKIFIIDDDLSIHTLWKERLQNIHNNKLSIQYFFEPSEFILYMQSNLLKSGSHFLIFIDYEFVGNSLNGLSIVEKLKIADRAILVTSHFDDKSIQLKAKELGVGIIPKTMVPFVPID